MLFCSESEKKDGHSDISSIDVDYGLSDPETPVPNTPRIGPSDEPEVLSTNLTAAFEALYVQRAHNNWDSSRWDFLGSVCDTYSRCLSTALSIIERMRQELDQRAATIEAREAAFDQRECKTQRSGDLSAWQARLTQEHERLRAERREFERETFPRLQAMLRQFSTWETRLSSVFRSSDHTL